MCRSSKWVCSGDLLGAAVSGICDNVYSRPLATHCSWSGKKRAPSLFSDLRGDPNRQAQKVAASSQAWPARAARNLAGSIAHFLASEPGGFAMSRASVDAPISFQAGIFPGLVTQGGAWHPGRVWLWVAFSLFRGSRLWVPLSNLSIVSSSLRALFYPVA